MVSLHCILGSLGCSDPSRCSVSYICDWRWLRCHVSFAQVTVAFPIICWSRNPDCDYSSAYVSLMTDSDLVGHGMTFTIGRGNDIVRPVYIPLVNPARSCQSRCAVPFRT